MNKLYGLIVCGGQSSRMGTDKSLLDYHGQPQRYYLYDMVSFLCERVFISCNEQQAASIPGKYEVIVDAPEYSNAGPMTALLSAFKAFPDVDFMVIGCDYPHLTKRDLQDLFEVKLQTINTAAFFNNGMNIYEPLIAIYQSVSLPILKNNFKLSKHSLSYFLQEINASKVHYSSSDTIKSIDTLEDYIEAKRIIAGDPLGNKNQK